MASKNEVLMEHIASLEPGEKVSVRRLAQQMHVSEGTAYKSIKAAEAQGLVITRPKTGTVRVNLRNAENRITLSEAALSIGAVCLCGAQKAASVLLPQAVIADGSAEQFQSLLHRAGEGALCLVGDRAELQSAAVDMGLHILLTGGAQMSLRLLHRAESSGICVYASGQDSATVLSMLSRRISSAFPHTDIGCVRDWMQLPRYLYHDDMVGEWNRVYGDIFSDSCICPVVDDSLRICGSVDAMTAMTTLGAYPSVRFLEITDVPEKCCTVPEGMSMDELADMLIRSKRRFAAVSSDGGMSGFIGMDDVIRYFLYTKGSANSGGNEGSLLELSSEEGEMHRRVYSIHIVTSDERSDGSVYLRLLISAASKHAADILGQPVCYDSGTFYSTSVPGKSGEYMISSELMRRSVETAVLELELFDDIASYYKCTLTMSVR